MPRPLRSASAPPSPNPKGIFAIERFNFANQLRGVAALCVVANHLTGVYWSEPQVVAHAIAALPNALPAPAFSATTAGAFYNFGPFGVALFFLISGFVIPMSLEAHGTIGFLAARAFRIYPTYLVAFALELACVALTAGAFHQPFPYLARSMIANALLATDLFNVPSIDLVNWTLVVELKFYLLMAVMLSFVRRGSLFALFATAGVILFVSRFSREIYLLIPKLGLLLLVFESNALYVLFMLIGVVFSYHVRGRIGTTRATASIVVLFLSFVLCWPLTFFRADFPVVTLNYGYALVVFAVCYGFRRFIPDWRIAAFFADISYPLYLVHALIGFSLMNALLVHGVLPIVATAIALGAVALLAFALHLTIERPSQQAGKRLAARIALVSARP